MAKTQKSNRGSLANERRYGDIEAADLREGARALRHVAASLDAAAESMQAAKLKALRTDGATRLQRGTKLLDDFTKNVRKALIDAGVE